MTHLDDVYLSGRRFVKLMEAGLTRRQMRKAFHTRKPAGRVQRYLRPDLAYRVLHSSIAGVQLVYSPMPSYKHGVEQSIMVVYLYGRLECSLDGCSVGLPPAVQRYLLRQFRRVFALPVSEREAFVQAHQHPRRIFP